MMTKITIKMIKPRSPPEPHHKIGGFGLSSGFVYLGSTNSPISRFSTGKALFEVDG